MLIRRIAVLLCLSVFLAISGSVSAAGEKSQKPGSNEDLTKLFSGNEEEPFLFHFDNLPDELDLYAFAGDHDDTYLGKHEKKSRHEDRISMFRLWRIMNDLDLTDEQVDEFFPLMRKMMKREKELAEEKNKLMNDLRAELKKEKTSEKELESLMSAIKAHFEKTMKEKKIQMEQFEGLLTVEQRARMMLSMDRTGRDIWESIGKVKYWQQLGKPYSLEAMEKFGYNKEDMQKYLEQARRQLEKINADLKEKGLPGLPEMGVPPGLNEAAPNAEEPQE